MARDGLERQESSPKSKYGIISSHVVVSSVEGCKLFRVTPRMVLEARDQMSKRASSILGTYPREEEDLAFLERLIFGTLYKKNPIRILDPAKLKEATAAIVRKLYLTAVQEGSYAAEEGRRIKELHILIGGNVVATRIETDQEEMLSYGDSFGEAGLDLSMPGKHAASMIAVQGEAMFATIDLAHMKAIVGNQLDLTPAMMRLMPQLRSDLEAKVVFEALRRRVRTKQDAANPLWEALDGLPLETGTQIIKGSELLNYPPNANVYIKGEDSHHIYVLLEGRVDIEGSRWKVVTGHFGAGKGAAHRMTVNPGESFGETEAWEEGSPRLVSAVTITPVSILRIPRDVYVAHIPIEH